MAGDIAERRVAAEGLLAPARVVAVCAAWLATVAAEVTKLVLLGIADPDGLLSGQDVVREVVGVAPVLALATLGAVVALRGDNPRYGWLMLATATTSAIVSFAGHYALYSYEATVPFVTVAVWVQDLWLISFMLLVFVLPTLLPDGRVASDRFPHPVRFTLLGWVTLIVLFMFTERAATNSLLDSGVLDPPQNPTGFLPVPMVVINVSWVALTFVSVVIGIASLVTRWRGSGREFKQQLKWVLFAFGIFVNAVAIELANQVLTEVGVDLGVSTLLDLLFTLGSVGLAVGLGFAVLRLRLYDVDLVINRTVVYGVLTVMVVLAYVAIVAGIGALLPVDEAMLALVVTGIVAVAFTPVRGRVQGIVNRLMFGQRDDPYAVLTEMGRLLARSGTPRDTLQEVTETVAASLKLQGAAIEIEIGGEWTRWAECGDWSGAAAKGAIIPLLDQGELVGRLHAAPRTHRESLSAKDVELLENVAYAAGALVRSARLAVALQRSREQLVLAREEERRRIRHDLHDEVGPTLASQTLQFDTILEQLREGPQRAVELVVALKEQNKELVADIRRLVYELRPPALDELGVVGALTAQATQFERSSPIAISVSSSPDPLPELPAALEVAAYRIAREAVSNAVRHAGAGECGVTLSATGHDLVVTVRDDGCGIDGHAPAGIGLTSMRERAEELGGTFVVRASPSAGTTVRVTLPLATRPKTTVPSNGSGATHD